MSINVPSEKAKAVIDAMEREMMDKIATKDDLIHVQQILSKDMERLDKDMERLEERLEERVKSHLATLEARLTVRLGKMMAAMIGTATALLGTVVYFS